MFSKNKTTTNKETKREGGLGKKKKRGEMPILGEKVAKPEGLDEHDTGIPMD